MVINREQLLDSLFKIFVLQDIQHIYRATRIKELSHQTKTKSSEY